LDNFATCVLASLIYDCLIKGYAAIGLKRGVCVNTWLDVAVVRCPNCGNYHVDASWYVIELESDIQCGRCRTEFNGKDNTTDRVLLKFNVDERGKTQNVRIAEHLSFEKNQNQA
jgi:NMD protein affecting ribosome stability and mRNA decay